MKKLSYREQDEEAGTVYVYLDPGTTRIYVTDLEGNEVKKFTKEIVNRARAYLYAKSLHEALSQYTKKRISSCIETPFKIVYDPRGFPDRESFPERLTTAQIAKALGDDILDKVQRGIPLNEAFRVVVSKYNLSSEDEQNVVKLLQGGN